MTRNLTHKLIATTALVATMAIFPTAQSTPAQAGETHAQQTTGMQELLIKDADGNRDLKGFVWYPAAADAETVRAHGNQVWEPIKVAPNASPIAGDFPVVVLSHGMFGNARNQAWFAERMVQAGYIVAAIDHPGTTTFNRDADERRMLWKRPEDISRTIDFLTDEWSLSDLTNEDHIYAAGHSLGGWTIAALAGAQYDVQGFNAFCDGQPNELVCNILQGWQVGADPMDHAPLQADLSDERIKAFAVFDLGGTQTFSKASLAEIDRPMLVYGAPAGEEETLDLTIESRAFVAAMPEENVRYLQPASYTHFDFVGVCTPMALEVLKEEEPDDLYVCRDGSEPRRAKHAQITREVTAFFAAH